MFLPVSLVIPVWVVQVFQNLSLTPEIEVWGPGGNLFPNGHHNVALLPRVDVRCAFNHPVSQLLPLVLGTWSWKAQSGMKTRKLCHVRESTRFLGTFSLIRADFRARRDRSGSPGRGIKPRKLLEIVGMMWSMSLNWSMAARLVQVASRPPVKEYLILQADTVLVCHAISSMGLLVMLSFRGDVCWMSENRALNPN